jgi:predicted amidohydrolase YtcJ
MSEHADLAFVGGGVYTVDAVRPWAEAIAVRDGRVAFVGTDRHVRERCGPDTQVVELAGRMLLPSFQDAHVHASAGGLNRATRVDLSESHSLDDYGRIIRAHADRAPNAPWILGAGWSLDVFPGGVPTREQLDAIEPGRPVFLLNRDHHGAWANSRALELAGIDASTPDPPDGRVERTGAGDPVGTLQEGAMSLVERVIPPVDAADRERGVLAAQEYLHGLGITAWQEAIVGWSYAGIPDSFEAYRTVDGKGELTGRVVAALWLRRGVPLDDQIEGFRERRALAAEDPAGRFRAATIKIMYDGVPENFTAAMIEPYVGREPDAEGGRGLSYFDAQDVKEWTVRLDAEGFQPHFHAIGDRAVRETLDAVEAARRANGMSDTRPHIAHIQFVHPDDRPRFRSLGVSGNAQMLWAQMDAQLSELTLPFVGEQRSEWMYPFGSLLAHGAQLAAGSDWPISTADPLQQMHVGVNRSAPPDYAFATEEGNAAGPMLPQERITLQAAIAAFTAGSAHVNHLDETGVIRPGSIADLVVLDRNLFAHPAAEVGSAKVDMTFVDGRLVYERAGGG